MHRFERDVDGVQDVGSVLHHDAIVIAQDADLICVVANVAARANVPPPSLRYSRVSPPRVLAEMPETTTSRSPSLSTSAQVTNFGASERKPLRSREIG